LMLVHVFDGGEALDGLRGEIAVGHRVADGDDLVGFPAQLGGDKAAEGTLAASGADGADRNQRDRRLDLSALRTEEQEVSSGRKDAGSEMHEVRVRNVAIREDHGLDVMVFYQLFEIVLLEDWDAFGIERSGEFGGIFPS